MANPAVMAWLRRTAFSEAAHSLLFGAGCFVLGSFVVGITWLAASLAVWVGLTTIGPFLFGPVVIESVLPGMGGIVVMALLFYGNARTTRKAIAETLRRPEAMSTDPDGRQGAQLRAPLPAYPATAGPLNLLYTGPRLVATAWNHTRRAARLGRLDYPACASIIELMMGRTTRVQLNELFWRTEPEDPIRPLAQLRDLGGILILRRKPGGVTLHPEWRIALAACFGSNDSTELSSLAAESTGDSSASPAAALGLPANASFEEVESGYRRRLRVVIPQRVRDPELRELTEDQMAATQSAYEAFLAQQRQEPGSAPNRTVEKLWEKHRLDPDAAPGAGAG